MTPEFILFLLRSLSAVLLLVFLGLITWFLFQDIRVGRQTIGSRVTSPGRLRVIANSKNDPAVGTTLELSPVSTIGRNSRNTIVLDDGYISGEHALIVWRDSNWWLEDLGSRNGTLLNEIPLRDPTVISAGDVLRIGAVQLKLEVGVSGPESDVLESGIRDSNP